MVAPKAVLRKRNILNEIIAQQQRNSNNNNNSKNNSHFDVTKNSYPSKKEFFDYQNETNDPTYSSASTTATFTSPLALNDDNSNDDNEVDDSNLFETSHNKSLFDTVTVPVQKYISQSIEQLVNGRDEDDNDYNLFGITSSNLTIGQRIGADAGAGYITGSSSNIHANGSSSSAILDTLLGSIMTTATAPVAPSVSASVASTSSSMAQLATSTYFHMISQQDHASNHHSHFHRGHHHHHNGDNGIDSDHGGTQLMLETATAATESPLSFLLSTAATGVSTAAPSDVMLMPSAINYNYNYNNDTTSLSSSTFWITQDDAEFDYLYRHSLQMTIVYCVAYVFVFLVGLIGNSFVIAVVLRAPRMRTVTNYFIVNLAIADILVIVFCLPATLMSNIFVPWILGWLMCKTVPYIQGVSVAASVYSLIAVSLDRFIAIWWPLKQMTKSRARFMILCIWIIALSSTIPWVLFFDLVPAADAFPAAPDMYLCQEVWPPGTNGNLYFLLAHLIACYLLPMSLITLCYVLIWIKVSTRTIPGDSKDAQMDRMQQKSKVKVIKMLVAVVILFVLSWLPLYVIFARIKFGGEISMEESEILNKVTPFAQWLGASNSCINPILYAFFNKKYRRGFAAIIKSRSCCGRLRYYDNVAIASSTTSTRKSSHYHQHNSNRKSPSSPGVRKTNAVSYIYEHNSLRRHNLMMKQDSNLSQQMLLKQDSHGSRQYLIKQESASSEGSRRLLCQQDSNGSKISLSKQDSIVSYVEAKRNAHLNNQDRVIDSVSTQDSISIDSRRGTIFKQDNQHCLVGSPTSSTLLEYKRQKFVKQDSVISFADQRPEPRRHQLVKQDSVISFADQRKGILSKQDSIIACPNKTGDGTGHHVSILKKTDSQLSNGLSSPRRNIEIYE